MFMGLGDGMATIAIIGALEKEVAQIKEELDGAQVAQEAGLTVVSGELDGLTVVATAATATQASVVATGAMASDENSSPCARSIPSSFMPPVGR